MIGSRVVAVVMIIITSAVCWEIEALCSIRDEFNDFPWRGQVYIITLCRFSNVELGKKHKEKWESEGARE